MKRGRPYGELVQAILQSLDRELTRALQKDHRYSTTQGGYHRWLYSIVAKYPTRQPRQIAHTIGRLKRSGLIVLGNNRVTLTAQGRAITKHFQAPKSLVQPEWDGYWRIVIWDVPERQRAVRDTIRLQLKHLGFVGIQKSVWVSPWPCRAVLDELRERLNLNPGLLMFETTELEGQDQLRHWFHLSPVSPHDSVKKYHDHMN